MNRRGFLRGLLGGATALAVGGVSAVNAAAKALAENNPTVVKPIGINPRAVKAWSRSLMIDAQRSSFFTRKLLDDGSIFVRVTDLSKSESDTFTYY